MKVLYKKQIFDNYKEVELSNSLVVSEIIDRLDIPLSVHKNVQVRINGHLLHPQVWGMARLKDHAVLSVALVPDGSSSGTEILKTLVIIGIAMYAGAPVAGKGVTGFTGLGWSGAAQVATTLVASLALNALFPPPQPELTSSPERTSLNAITGQSNRPDPYGVVIRNYGRNRIYPRLVVEPFIEYTGSLQYMVAIYDFGLSNAYGDSDLEQEIDRNTLKIGDTDLNQFNDIFTNVANDPDDLIVYTQRTITESVSFQFEDVGDNETRGVPANSSGIGIVLSFPQGLTIVSGANLKRKNRETTIKLRVELQRAGSSYWSSFTNYPYEVDSKYSVSSGNSSKIFIIPDSITFIKSVTSQYGGIGGSPSTTKYYEYSLSNDVIKFRSLSPTSQKVPVVGDKLTTGEVTSGPRGTLSTGGTAFYARITEVISTETIDGLEYYNVKLDRTINFSGEAATGSLISLPIGVTTTLSSFPSTIDIKANTLSPFDFEMKINTYDKADYDIRIYYEGLTTETIGSSPDYFTDFTWTSLKAFTSDLPIATYDNHNYLELRILGTGQLNGIVDQLSGEVHSILWYYDTASSSWKRKKSSNPAWVFVDILTGNINQRAISKDQMDVDSLVRWANYCENNTIVFQDFASGFECNFVLDYAIGIKDLLSQVCSVGRATLNIVNGKFGVVIDEERTIPTQIFNQRNVKTLAVSRNYSDIPQAIKVTYIDPQSNWQKNEVIAYDDGETSSTAEIIEEIEMFATTNIAQAWRQGRYFLAQNKLRQNNVTITVDFENLVCSRGDLVYLSNDTMKIGGLPARVLSISGNEVTLDEPVSDQGGSYVLRARIRATDEIKDLSVLTFTGTHTVEVDDVDALQYNDLVVFGETSTVTRSYIVKSILYSDNLQASLQLVEYNPAIFDADVGTIGEYFANNQSDPLSGGVYPGAVENLVAGYNIQCNISEKRYIYLIDIAWEAPTNNIVDTYEIYVTINGQQNLIGFTKNNEFVYTVQSTDLNVSHKFTVIGVDGAGRKMPLQNATSVSFIPTQDSTRPENVTEFNANILTETIELDWRLVDDCDIDRYYIRYSPKTSGALWAQSIKLTTAGSTQNSVQVPLRTGTYFVKAQDWAGNISETAAFLRTQVPEVLKIEFISRVTAPAWTGVYNDTELVGTKLKLKSNDNDVTYVNSFGDFFFDEIFDLGDIFTARFTSKILASGYSGTSLMKNWTTLNIIDPIAGEFSEDDFDAAAYIRTRNDADVMANWVTLDTVDYLSFGSELTATPWQRFKSADFTGRIFQLKIQLEGNADQTVSPVVYEVDIEASWNERIIDGKDVVSGTRVDFDGAFVSIPAIQVTSFENIASGDYHLFTEKDEAGFKVQFYDSGDNPIVTPKFDWVAKGIGKKYTLEDINF